MSRGGCCHFSWNGCSWNARLKVVKKLANLGFIVWTVFLPWVVHMWAVEMQEPALTWGRAGFVLCRAIRSTAGHLLLLFPSFCYRDPVLHMACLSFMWLCSCPFRPLVTHTHEYLSKAVWSLKSRKILARHQHGLWNFVLQTAGAALAFCFNGTLWGLDTHAHTHAHTCTQALQDILTHSQFWEPLFNSAAGNG